ncbi:myelin-associated glycoprotein-like [Colossoma macropomum]|uniref:myelin-associated glycoprotein-like n=1 Tax=Colossoma macropomum TaxID=42526 RepID=UPI00186526E3|nr:myelin-associated glycoprotein-like [Colossoma macropomum]
MFFKGSMFFRDWTFSMPNAIRGVRGSCVVIPCNFDFKTTPPPNVNVKWYKFSDTQYPLVYDQSAQNVITKFRGKTSLYGSPNEGNCSLKIQPLEMQHNQERLYPWMDPKPIETYHRENYLDVTIALEVTETPDKPVISDLPEELEPDKQITINCSVTHTCPSQPPTITWSIPTAKKVVSHTETSAGQWKTISTVTYVPTGYEEEEDLICTASFWRGKKQESSVELPVKSYEGLRMETIGPYILAPLFLVLLLGVAIAGAIIYRRRSIWSHFSRLPDQMVRYNEMSTSTELIKPNFSTPER